MSNLSKLLTCFLCLCLFSCSDSNSIETLDELRGLDEKAIISKFGNPGSENSYRMSDEIVNYEINRNLLSIFSSDSSIVIHDMIWNKSGYKIKVWFQKKENSWKVVDAIKFSDGIRF